MIVQAIFDSKKKKFGKNSRIRLIRPEHFFCFAYKYCAEYHFNFKKFESAGHVYMKTKKKKDRTILVINLFFIYFCKWIFSLSSFISILTWKWNGDPVDLCCKSCYAILRASGIVNCNRRRALWCKINTKPIPFANACTFNYLTIANSILN